MIQIGVILQSAGIERVGWMLVHSVWQLAIITAVYALGVFCLRRSSANARYLTGGAALLAMIAVPAATFIGLSSRDLTVPALVEWPALLSDEGATGGRTDAATEQRQQSPEMQRSTQRGLAEGSSSHTGFTVATPLMHTWWAQRLQPLLPWLSGGWLIGVILLAVRPLWGGLMVHRLRTKGLSSLSSDVQELAVRLVDRMAIRKTIIFAHSALVEVPTVIGYMRPVVLLPASAITGLTVEQLELIVAHELAHVRRHDYLVNAAQTIIEALLFFHPGMWWVSAQVRKERENCCDDIAVDVCGNREAYAHALTTLETLRTRHLVVALHANGSSLLERIRRLTGDRANAEPTLQRNAAWLGGLLVVLAMSLTLGMLTYNVAAGSASYGVKAPVSADVPLKDEQQQGDKVTAIGKERVYQDVKKAVAEIERLGGDFQEDGEPARIVSVNLSSTKLDDEALARLAQLTDVHTLALNRTRITDAGLKHLKDMKQLQWLELEGTPINGSGLKNLAGMEHLLTLRLGRTKVDDASLVHVMQMKDLLELWVEKTQITQAGLRELWKIRPSLRVVGADGLKPGDTAQAERLLSSTVERAAGSDMPTQRDVTKLVMDAMHVRDQRVQSFLFEWNTRHQYQVGTLRHSGMLLSKGPANREEVAYDLETKMIVNARRMSFEFSGLRPKVEKNGDVLMRRETYRSAFDGMSERSLFEYPSGSDRPQGFQNVASVSEHTKLAETAPLLWSFCTFDDAMVNHDWSQLEVLDERTTINGVECVVLTGNLLPLVIGGQQRPSENWYVDAKRDYAIVRYEHRLPDGRLTLRTDIDQINDPQWGWVPSGWTITRSDAAAKVSSTLKATVTQYQLNPTLPNEVFELEYPDNTHMNRP
jgi:beta-lactamase regulating signal transducer with metallopeptidase domain